MGSHSNYIQYLKNGKATQKILDILIEEEQKSMVCRVITELINLNRDEQDLNEIFKELEKKGE